MDGFLVGTRRSGGMKAPLKGREPTVDGNDEWTQSRLSGEGLPERGNAHKATQGRSS
jgi:hypothetical protein